MDSGNNRGWTGQIDWPPPPPLERGRHRKTTSSGSWTPVPKDGASGRRAESAGPLAEVDRCANTTAPEPVESPEEAGRVEITEPFAVTASLDDRPTLDHRSTLDDTVPVAHTVPVTQTIPVADASRLDDAGALTGSRPVAVRSSGQDTRARRTATWLVAGSSVAALCGLLAAPATLQSPGLDMPLPGIGEEHVEALPHAQRPPARPNPAEPRARTFTAPAQPALEAPRAEVPTPELAPPAPPEQPPDPPTAEDTLPLGEDVGSIAADTVRLVSRTLTAGVLGSDALGAQDIRTRLLQLDLTPPGDTAQDSVLVSDEPPVPSTDESGN